VPEAFTNDLAKLNERHTTLNARFGAWRAGPDHKHPAWFRLVDPLFRPIDRFGAPVRAALRRLPRMVRIVATALALGSFAAWLPGFPGILILLLTAFLGQRFIFRRTSAARDFRLRHVWPGVAVFMIGYVVATGLTYSGPRPATYHFQSDARVTDGSYGELGHTDAFIYLRPCSGSALGSFAVPGSAIRLIELPPPASRPLPPSLLDVTLGGRTLNLGSASQCEDP
jgi:hypothetical protein